MRMSKNLWRPAIIAAAIAFVASCSDGNNGDVLGPQPSGTASIFQNYVALGNSITAGFQSSGINDSTQKRAYPVLLAQQMGTAMRYPQLAGRGCVPPVSNFVTQARIGTGATSTTCDLRTPTNSDLLNNVAVPNAFVEDLTDADGTANSNALTSLFLAGKSQVEKANLSDPTFASIWIGNNDVLAAAVSGVLVATAGVSPGVTAQATFETRYNAATDALIAHNSALKGVLIGVVKVTNAPVLFRASLLLPAVATNPVYAAFRSATGYNATGTPGQQAALTVDNNCTGSTALVSFRLASAIATYRANPAAAGAHPPHVACGTNTIGLPATVGEIFILTQAEQDALNTAVTAYNTFISAEAASLDFAYMDPNVLLDSLKTANQLPAFPDLANPTRAFAGAGCTSTTCPWVSLDGVHPTDRTHRALTNHIINAINAKYGTTLLRVLVN